MSKDKTKEEDGLIRLAKHYGLCFFLSLILHFVLSYDLNLALKSSLWSVLGIGYLFTYLIAASWKGEGYCSPFLQNLSLWNGVAAYFNATVTCETGELPSEKQYIFASFPHGTCTIHHALTATDCCGMLSKVYRGSRRDLAATVLFYIPFVREVIMLTGNVDASASTAHYNLRKGHSLLIFIGGEKEQLMTRPNEHKIYCKERKGFIKLALQYGTPIVPTYCFGENETYHTSDLFIGFRKLLQKHFKLGIPIIWGVYGTLMPLKVKMGVEIGKPIPVQKLSPEQITPEAIDALHTEFLKEMNRLFERTKRQYGVPDDQTLLVL